MTTPIFPSRASLARALSILTTSGPIAATDGTTVIGDSDSRTLAQAMLMRAGLSDSRASIDALAIRLDALLALPLIVLGMLSGA